MWVFEEFISGKKLTDVINTQHENTKYMPGVPASLNPGKKNTHVINLKPSTLHPKI